MGEQLCLRWERRRGSLRPANELIRTSEYDVAELADDTTAKRYVLEHHYSGSYPAARFRFGLYRRGDLVGVAVFSQPMHPAVLAPFNGDGAELGRLVLHDQVPGNAETWFLARCFDQLRPRTAGVVSHSDPVPRTTASGRVVFAGHLGTIYQAHNAVYRGRATARVLQVLPDGRVFSARSIQKIRSLDRGWRYSVGILVDHGAEPLDTDDQAEARDWLARWLPRLTRPLRHPGNHRYLWGLSRSARRALPPGLPYPKAA